MHARDLLELAALVAEHGPALVRQWEPIPEASVAAYWSASRCRLDRWHRELKRFASPATISSSAAPSTTHASLVGAMEEVLTGEVLTRVWAAVASAYDRRRGTDLVAPVAGGVLASHTEAQHRVLTVLVSGSALVAEEAMRLDRLRRLSERWTDVLLGHLGTVGSVREFAFDPERAEDFAADFAPQGRDGGLGVWPLMMSSMRAAFRRGLAAVSPNADLNAKIAASIVSSFPPEWFQAVGVPESLWLLRVSQTATAAEGLIDDLLRC
jgi:hypothetical protein